MNQPSGAVPGPVPHPPSGEPRWSGESMAGSPEASWFGTVAEEYDRVRPGYPAEVVSWVLPAPGAGPLRVLDLGAGTGKLTRELVALGHEVVAVEPDDALRARLAATTAGVELLAGVAEDVPLPDRSVDAAVVGQAWHWMDHDRAGPELGRVVRPGGTVGLLWNLRRLDDPLQQAIVGAVGDGPDGYAGQTLDLSVPGGSFEPGEHRVVDNPVDYEVDEVVELVSTWSFAMLGGSPDRILRRVREVLTPLADRSGRVRYAQVTSAYRFQRRATGAES